MFTSEDLQQIQQHGLSREAVEKQLENFRNGFPYLKIIRSAQVGDGIFAVDGGEADALRAEYREAQQNLKIEKFVPASGAATRMFKDLFSFVESGEMNPVVARCCPALWRPARRVQLSMWRNISRTWWKREWRQESTISVICFPWALTR